MDFYYQFLSSSSQKNYKHLLCGIKGYEKNIFLPGCFSEEYLSKLIELISYDHPEIFYVDFSRLIYLKGVLGIGYQPFYIGSPSHIKSKSAFLQSQAMEILKKMQDSQIESYYARVRWIHNYLIRYIHYDYQSLQTSNPSAHSIEGVLEAKCGVCEGIAKTFLYLCSLENIRAALITGSANGDEVHLEETSLHAWNLVDLDNTWYHIDCTFDLCQSQEVNANRYDYFCLSDTDIMKDHTFKKKVTCLSNEKSFFKQTNRIIKSPGDLRAYVKKCLAAGKRVLYFKISSEVSNMDAVLNKSIAIIRDILVSWGYLGAYQYYFNTAQGIIYLILTT